MTFWLNTVYDIIAYSVNHIYIYIPFLLTLSFCILGSIAFVIKYLVSRR